MNSSRYCFDTKVAADFPSLLRHFTGKRLQSPYRSTVPLLSLIEHNRAQWESLLASLGAQGDAMVHLEYCVPSPKAGGNPSQTDAMVLSASVVLAIEAKWTEPRDKQTIVKRVTKLESDGADPRRT